MSMYIAMLSESVDLKMRSVFKLSGNFRDIFFKNSINTKYSVDKARNFETKCGPSDNLLCKILAHK